MIAAACTLGCGDSLAVQRLSCSEKIALESPDGRYRAVVRSHPTIDGPNESLWIYEQTGDRARTRVTALGEDTQWCEEIIWEPDSSRVFFRLNDQKAYSVDPAAPEWLTLHIH